MASKKKEVKVSLKISSNTRVAKAGRALGEAIVEMVHLLYLRDNALEFLNALTFVLNEEFKRRRKEWVTKKEAEK